jgi:hypothetical protein
MPVPRSPIELILLAAIITIGVSTVAGCGSGSASATSNPTQEKAASSSAADGRQSVSLSKPRPKLRPGAKTVALKRAGDRAYDKTFDDLRFEMDLAEPFQRRMLTAEIEALNDQHIRIRGFMLPTAQKRGIRQFVLVRDNQECCFGPGAAIYDCILVEMQPGKTAEYSIRPVAVAGTFAIHELMIDDRLLAIYHLKADSVE